MTGIPNIKVENRKGYIWISFPNSIVRENILQIQNRIESILTDESSHAALDLSNIDILGSIVIDLIMFVNKILTNLKGSICVVNLSEACLKQFQTMNLDKVVTIYGSEGEMPDLGNETSDS